MNRLVATDEFAERALRGPVRLRTLTGLRWLAVAGQIAAILIVHFALGFPLPLGLCLAVIAVGAWLNVFIMLRFSSQGYLSDQGAAASIAFDIAQLCALLFLTGGLQNPFCVLILAPVTIAASVLPLRLTLLIGALAFAGISLEGSTVRPDGDANSDLYGKNVDPKDVAVGKVQGVPNRLTQVLQKVSPKNLSDVDSDAKKNPN